jgi:hypothetical protein
MYIYILSRVIYIIYMHACVCIHNLKAVLRLYEGAFKARLRCAWRRRECVCAVAGVASEAMGCVPIKQCPLQLAQQLTLY